MKPSMRTIRIFGHWLHEATILIELRVEDPKGDFMPCGIEDK